MRMVDQVDLLVADGGPAGLGYVEGSIDVDPGAWFFEAHFLGDPVWPGSLGLQAFVQLLAAYAVERWGLGSDAQFETVPGEVPPQMDLPRPDPGELQASARAGEHHHRGRGHPYVARRRLLSVDGKTIYEMRDFSLGVRR